jgi:hypothetical protein
MVAAGAVVTTNVRDFALVVGVPAKERGWVGRGGRVLDALGQGRYRCPLTGEEYSEGPDGLELCPNSAYSL